MRSLPAVLVSLLAPTLALVHAAPSISDRVEKSPRHQEWVEVKRGDHTVHVFVVYPEIKEKALTVIVIHENRGLNDWARSVADRLAENGYIAIAPDLLSGAAPGGGRTKDFATQSAATEAIGKLKPADVVADLNAVADYAKTIPSANGKQAVIGFCWGGGKSWALALARPGLEFAGVFYGTPPADADYGKVTAPIYGFYGGSDSRVNATIEKSTAGMQAVGKTYEPVVYEGAGHAFMRSGEEADATPANKAAAEGGWKRLLELLGKTRG